MTEPHVISSGASEGTSSNLLKRVRQHDQTAWGQLVDLYSPLVWRWCRRANLQPADIEDVSQEVFRSVYRALPNFRKDKPGDSFRAWLRTITVNKVRDHWKDREVSTPGDSGSSDFLGKLADPRGEPSLEVEDEQEVSILFRRAVQVLRTDFEDRTWQAFWRVAIDDESVESVAQTLQMSPNAVYLARSRVRKRLREMFAGLGEQLPE